MHAIGAVASCGAHAECNSARLFIAQLLDADQPGSWVDAFDVARPKQAQAAVEYPATPSRSAASAQPEAAAETADADAATSARTEVSPSGYAIRTDHDHDDDDGVVSAERVSETHVTTAHLNGKDDELSPVAHRRSDGDEQRRLHEASTQPAAKPAEHQAGKVGQDSTVHNDSELRCTSLETAIAQSTRTMEGSAYATFTDFVRC